jgi:H+/Cl- antiporter ClcA
MQQPTSEPSNRWRQGAAYVRPLLEILPLVAVIAAGIGAACAFFLWSLDEVTRVRFQHPWLLYGLPFGGVLVGWIYHRFGGKADGGNNLIIEQIHEPGGGVPLRMAPLVLFGTLVTHLFGGSAGREGTAVQMGGSIAGGAARLFKLGPEKQRLLLLAGISAGFGAVFGTPLAGAVFALEVLVIGRISYEALMVCLVSALVGDGVCRAFGAGHTHYALHYLEGKTLPETAQFYREPLFFLKIIIAGVLFGLASRFFASLTHGISGFCKKRITIPWLRPALGGVVVILLAWLIGADYLGLGILPMRPDSLTLPAIFSVGAAHPWSWLWKIIFTAVTVGCGFKGGEVTPLFFIGAALGAALSKWLGLPVDLMAALGFVAVFAGAANTPLACTLMGIELFGAAISVPVAMVCFVAYYASGHTGIYLSQRLGVGKSGGPARAGETLREWHSKK